MTGGGFGGSIIVLAVPESTSKVATALSSAYEEFRGIKPRLCTYACLPGAQKSYFGEIFCDIAPLMKQLIAQSSEPERAFPSRVTYTLPKANARFHFHLFLPYL